MGQPSIKAAKETVVLEAAMPSKRLRRFMVSGVDKFDVKATVMKAWVEDHAKHALNSTDLGDFIEIQLVPT